MFCRAPGFAVKINAATKYVMCVVNSLGMNKDQKAITDCLLPAKTTIPPKGTASTGFYNLTTFLLKKPVNKNLGRNLCLFHDSHCAYHDYFHYICASVLNIDFSHCCFLEIEHLRKSSVCWPFCIRSTVTPLMCLYYQGQRHHLVV